jgi:IS30 family transposase
MARAIIDRVEVKELFDKGNGVTEIANKLGCVKGTISKILKEMGLTVAKAAVAAAPKYEKKKDTATAHLLFLANKAKKELEWIEKEIKPKTDSEYREWQDQKLKFAVEMRRLISAIADIGYKLFQVSELTEILRIIDEEIGHESKECQQRIRDRLKSRRDIRFPVNLDRPTDR